MSLAPHHDDLVRELESVQADGQAAHIVRQLHHQARTAAALRRSLSTLSGEVSPEQTYRAQSTENAWRAIEAEFGLLTAAEVARIVGSTAKSAKSYAADARRALSLQNHAGCNHRNHGRGLDTGPVRRKDRRSVRGRDE